MVLPVVGAAGWGVTLNQHIIALEALVNTIDGEVDALQAGVGAGSVTAAQITDASATGRALITAATTALARVAIGAGTSNLALGSTSSTAKAGDYQPNVLNTVAAAGTTEALPGTANFHDVTLNVASCAISLPVVTVPTIFTVVLRQDATGGRAVTFPPTVNWIDSTAPPTLDPVPSAVTVLTLLTVDGGLTWYGQKRGTTTGTGTPSSTYDAGVYGTATFAA